MQLNPRVQGWRCGGTDPPHLPDPCTHCNPGHKPLRLAPGSFERTGPLSRNYRLGLASKQPNFEDAKLTGSCSCSTEITKRSNLCPNHRETEQLHSFCSPSRRYRSCRSPILAISSTIHQRSSPSRHTFVCINSNHLDRISTSFPPPTQPPQKWQPLPLRPSTPKATSVSTASPARSSASS